MIKFQFYLLPENKSAVYSKSENMFEKNNYLFKFSGGSLNPNDFFFLYILTIDKNHKIFVVFRN